MTSPNKPYRGRFAPSPTGKLHFGSLIAAIGSYLQAKSLQGQWLLRIEDLDQTRVVPHAADQILSTLSNFGFEWDEDIIYQSHRTDLYQTYFEELKTKNLLYACDCSRNKLKQDPSKSTVYPGYCRHKSSTTSPHATRCKTSAQTISFYDQVQGQYSVNLEKDCGDFIIKRRDNFFAYNLAVVVDDAAQGITDIVRGADLLSTTPQQIYLQQQLDCLITDYAHLPVVMHLNGKKLSKSHQDLPIQHHQPVEIMTMALIFLNQSPPKELGKASLQDFWHWAIQNWTLNLVQNKQAIPFILDL